MAAKTTKATKKTAGKKTGTKAKATAAAACAYVQKAGTRLPAGSVKLSGERELSINVQKLSKGLIRDQRARMVSSMGCISNPGGPGC